MTPAQLIKNAKRRSRCTTGWIHGLTIEQGDYLCSVIKELKKDASAPILVIARILREEFKLQVSAETIARTLRNRIHG